VSHLARIFASVAEEPDESQFKTALRFVCQALLGMEVTQKISPEVRQELLTIMRTDYHAPNGGGTLDEVAELVKTIDDEPEPVEPVDWPTEPGVWQYRDNEEASTRLACAIYWNGEMVVSPFQRSGIYHRSDRDWDQFIKCTVTVPPIKEPEPKPGKPASKRLLANLPEHGWKWGTIIGRQFFGDWLPLYTLWLSRIPEVDRTESDPEALEIYDREHK